MEVAETKTIRIGNHVKIIETTTTTTTIIIADNRITATIIKIITTIASSSNLDEIIIVSNASNRNSHNITQGVATRCWDVTTAEVGRYKKVVFPIQKFRRQILILKLA